MSRRNRNRLCLAAVVLTAGALLIAGAMRGALTYYRTPAEVLASPQAVEGRTRVGGTVVPGSVRRDGDRIRFQLAADGVAIAIDGAAAPPATFRDGQDAVVEGTLGRDGVFRADAVLVRHGNEYQPSPAAGG